MSTPEIESATPPGPRQDEREVSRSSSPSLHDASKPLLSKAYDQFVLGHSKVPLIRRLPPKAVGIILLIALVNIVVWVAVGVVLSFHGSLVSTAVLAYTLGLRHALDADHISAIDLMTRRLVAAGQKPVTVGMFFSLGHSTIVIVTSIVVAATASAVSDKFDDFSRVGGIIGTSVSAAFLILLGVANSYILYKLIKQLKAAIDEDEDEGGFKLEGAGCLFNLMKRLFKIVDRPWKMYPLGVLFGLGFDTSSEVALLGISSIEAVKGTSMWLILILPVLFTAGMCLLDTTDGALMMSLYTMTSLARDKIAILYYSIVLTIITVVVAIVIGVIQLLSLLGAALGDPEGGFWDGMGVVGEYYDVIGGAICASFIVFGLLSMVVYRPWRRRIDRIRAQRRAAAVETSADPAQPDDVVPLADEHQNEGLPESPVETASVVVTQKQ